MKIEIDFTDEEMVALDYLVKHYKVGDINSLIMNALSVLHHAHDGDLFISRNQELYRIKMENTDGR
jgi:hypothetical protein